MIAESLNMSVGSVFTIMTEDLKKKKLCARFMPHTLTTEQKEHRIASSEDLIAAADEDPNFLKTIVTGDESWCLEYDPETKRQSSEWTSPGKGRPMKVRASKSKTKTMLLVFFDSRGIIHHEFLRQGSTVIGAFYKDVLHQLLKRMRRVVFYKYGFPRNTRTVQTDNDMAAIMKDFLAKKIAQKTMLSKLKQKLSEPNLSISELKLLRTKFKNLQDEFNSMFNCTINLRDEVNVEKVVDEQD
ncbi:histone-lysine N-methyltransferase SETMAR [Nephila pilipes]|uniref:Histone-lysine N-methyltransferase SETMAR n=1 Tax=Nephila pilipes TaxID=299642 RepID=A0A8X6QJN3_NEPPI|nr:histone-lysine N-methyltransferase SETMAR [Nephila pilipes]